MNEGFIKTPIEPQNPDTKFLEAEAEAESSCKKNITKTKLRPNPSKTAFKEAEAETEANDF